MVLKGSSHAILKIKNKTKILEFSTNLNWSKAIVCIPLVCHHLAFQQIVYINVPAMNTVVTHCGQSSLVHTLLDILYSMGNAKLHRTLMETTD